MKSNIFFNASLLKGKEFFSDLHQNKVEKNNRDNIGVGSLLSYKDIDNKERLDIINTILENDFIKEITATRNSLLLNVLRSNYFAPNVERYREVNQMLAYLIGNCFLAAAEKSKGSNKKMKASNLFKISDTDAVEIQEQKTVAKKHLAKISFVLDFLRKEAKSLDKIMKDTFPNQDLHFELLEEIIRSLDGALSFSGSKGEEKKQEELFVLYMSSISNYLDKRIDTYLRKSKSLER